MEELMGFFSSTSVWVYVFIFVGKILEVTIATLRIVLISRGERLVGSMVAIVEVTLWVVITGTVLSGFQSDALKIVVFVIAFAIGNYLGSWLEEKLAFGLCSIQVVSNCINDANHLSYCLREKHFGVTVMDARGKDETRGVLVMTLKRKRVKEALTLIHENCKNAVITVSDVKALKGGYLRNSSTRLRKFFK